MRKPEYRIVLPQIDELQELKVMLADRLEEWALDYEAQGMKKGMQQGEMLALQKLITKRFGVIPASVLSVIAGASSVQIELWLDRVLDAHSLDDLFAPTNY